MTRLTFTKREKAMIEQADLYKMMSADLRAQATGNAIKRMWAREQAVGA